MDNKQLIKKWIQYLKGLQIVDMNSDPETGDLRYKRKVTVDDLVNFLEVKTDFSPDQIASAIQSVSNSKKTSTQLTVPGDEKSTNKSPDNKQEPNSSKERGLSTWFYHGIRPGEHPTKQIPARKTDKLQYNPSDVIDVNFRDLPPKNPPPAEAKPSTDTTKKVPRRLKKLREDIKDISGEVFSEDDIEKVFTILTGSKNKNNSPVNAKNNAEEQQENLRKVKRIIRDVMNDQQRKYLWTILSDHSLLNEDQLGNTAIKLILKTAAEKRNKPSGIGRIFKNLRKDSIDLNDLQKAWADMGYPDDSRDINKLLLAQGFSKREISKAFSSALGKDEEQVQNSETVDKIARLIKKYGIEQQILDFMKNEYKFKESVHERLMFDDIRILFTEMVKQERSERARLIKLQDNTYLGRSKK